MMTIINYLLACGLLSVGAILLRSGLMLLLTHDIVRDGEDIPRLIYNRRKHRLEVRTYVPVALVRRREPR